MSDLIVTDLLAAVGADLGAPAASALLARYDEPWRAYHTREHLSEAFAALTQVGGADDPVARVALWYHDAVYDPRRADNEAASADLAAVELAAAGRPADFVAAVRRLVLATATHDSETDDGQTHDSQTPDCETHDGQTHECDPPGPGGRPHATAALCDADLWILSAPPARYARYVAQVRREYAHVGDLDFAAGRAAILRELAGRAALYVTPVGATWEAAARANLAGELRGYGSR